MKTTRNAIALFAVTSLAAASLPFATFAHGPDDAPQVVNDRAPLNREQINERLRNIANLMEAAHFQLSRKTTGQPTQEDQSRAISLLQELIERMQQPLPPTPPPSGGQPDDGGTNTPPTNPPEPRKPDEPRNLGGDGTPAPLSKVGDESGTREVESYESQFRRDWKLQLSPMQMERLTREFSEKYPDRYRDLLAEYFKQLGGKR